MATYEEQLAQHIKKQQSAFAKLPEYFTKYCQGGQDYISPAIDNPEVEFWCVVYGQHHIDMLRDICLPTLFANREFDKLTANKRVLCNIYTRKEEITQLQPIIDVLLAHNIDIRVNITLLDPVIDPILYTGPFDYNALCLLDQIRSSIQHESIIVSVLPDLLFMGGSLYNVINDMQPNQFVVSKGPRITSEVAIPDILEHYKEHGKYELKEFISLCMDDWIHSQNELCIQKPNKMLAIESTKAGYTVHTACPQPLAFYGQPKHIKRMLYAPATGNRITNAFFCIDNDFIDMAHKDGELVYITDTDKFFWAELTSMHTHKAETFLSNWEAVSQGYYPSGYEWCRQQEIKWKINLK